MEGDPIEAALEHNEGEFSVLPVSLSVCICFNFQPLAQLVNRTVVHGT